MYYTNEDKKLMKLVDNFLEEIEFHSTSDVFYYMLRKLDKTKRSIIAQEIIEYIE